MELVAMTKFYEICQLITHPVYIYVLYVLYTARPNKHSTRRVIKYVYKQSGRTIPLSIIPEHL